MIVLNPQPQAFVSEGPQPLLREISRGANYPIEALGTLRPLVEAVQSTTQAPVAIAAQSALSVAALATQGHANVESLGGPVPCSLFCLTVARSGERKTGCDKLIMSGLRDFEIEKSSEFREDMNDWARAEKIWQAKSDRLFKEAAGANKDKATAAEADLVGLGPKPTAPLSPKLTSQEPTIEGLFKLYMAGQPSLGLFTDEGGGFVGGHAMNAENKLKTIAGLCGLWGGEPIDRVRAGDGATTLFGRRLSAHIMIQPVIARRLLADAELVGQGFLPRFLITEPETTIGSRFQRGAIPKDAAAISNAKRHLSDILLRPMNTSETDAQELRPRLLTLDVTARKILVAYSDEVEREQGPDGGYEQLSGFASKSQEQAARIAGVLTLWGDITATVVGPDIMADAVALAKFYLGEAKRLADTAAVSDEVGRAEQLRKWILETWPDIARRGGRDPDYLVPSDVTTSGPLAMRVAATAKPLLSVLAEHGWLAPLDAGAMVDGKARRKSYRIVGAQ
jgi:hypothetical protein